MLQNLPDVLKYCRLRSGRSTSFSCSPNHLAITCILWTSALSPWENLHPSGWHNMDGCYPWMNRSSIIRTWLLRMPLNLSPFILLSLRWVQWASTRSGKHTPRCQNRSQWKTISMRACRYLLVCAAYSTCHLVEYKRVTDNSRPRDFSPHCFTCKCVC